MTKCLLKNNMLFVHSQQPVLDLESAKNPLLGGSKCQTKNGGRRCKDHVLKIFLLARMGQSCHSLVQSFPASILIKSRQTSFYSILFNLLTLIHPSITRCVDCRCWTVYEQLPLFTLMKRRCGVKQGLRNRWFDLQNEIKTRWGGLQTRDRF